MMAKNTKGDWLAKYLEDPEFQRFLAREEFIEEFLNHVDSKMKREAITRAELARRMGCKASNVTQLFRRTRNLTASTMVDIAFHLGLKLRLIFDAKDHVC